jgi:hypothetical protein
MYGRRNCSVILLTATIALFMAGFLFSPTRAENQLVTNVPKITVSPPVGPVQTPITITGSNFKPGANVNLYWFGYITDTPGVKGHLGSYVIRPRVTVGQDGTFRTSFNAPYDFSDITHAITATQDSVEVSTVNATFRIMSSLQLSPQPSDYADGQEILVRVSGGPLGTPAFAMKLAPRLTVLKFTYDDKEWGYATSHLETEGPIVTGGFVGGDIGGNITIRLKAVGGVGKHVIRAYEGEKETPVYLPCEAGGEAVFNVVGPSRDTQSVLSRMEGTTNYSLGALVVSALNLVVLAIVAVRVFKKT